jgi:hypothetical protein
MNDQLITHYRPAGPEELELVKRSGFTRWPPRLPEQPIFYAVTNEEYATQIARRWNIPDQGAGYVTCFKVRKSFMELYPIQKVGRKIHTEWWIPSDDLEELNKNILGLIEVIGEYRTD